MQNYSQKVQPIVGPPLSDIKTKQEWRLTWEGPYVCGIDDTRFKNSEGTLYSRRAALAIGSRLTLCQQLTPRRGSLCARGTLLAVLIAALETTGRMTEVQKGGLDSPANSAVVSS